MNAMHEALAQLARCEGLRVEDVQRMHGPMAAEGLVAQGYAARGRDGVLRLTEAGERAHRDVAGMRS